MISLYNQNDVTTRKRKGGTEKEKEELKKKRII
jgi:hypothetical protein